MDVLIIFIISLGLAMDCFALAIANSTVSGHVDPGIPLKAALIFSFIHFLLLLAGFWVGGMVQHLFTGMEAWAAFVVFTIIAFKMIREAMKRRSDAKVFDINNIQVILIMATAAAMDAFLAGLAMGIVHARAYLAAGIVAFAVFLFTFSGLAGGKQLGLEFAKRTAIFGGVFMLIAAVHFLISVFIW
jgi:manganese efflux pump family protein